MRFGHGRKTKNGENCISATAETEKTPQTGFPTPWMSRKQEKWLSNPLDEQKTEENGFPTPWMSKKLKKLAFQPLG